MDDPSFLAFLQHEEARARLNDLSEERAVALDYYNGEPFGDEEEGRSQLVTRDVAEVVDHMVISIMRTMVSGDRVVEFEATRKEDVQACDDATVAVGQQFMNEQDGYTILHDFLKAGLLEKTGYAKSYVEEQQPERIEGEIAAEELVTLEEQGLQVIEAEALDEEATAFRVAALRPVPPKFIDVAVPNEEALVATDTRDLEKSAYVGHKTQKTLSELREMGFEDVEGLEPGGLNDTALASARDDLIDTDQDRDGPNRTVWLLEEYVRYDLNGDGVTELLCVHRVGTRILDVKEADEQPLTAWCPFPMQHRLVGQSLFDKTGDLQRTRSVLLRQFMDGTYQSTAPRTLVHEDALGDNTIDDLLTVRPGALIRWRGMNKPEPFNTGFNTGDTLNALQVMMDERENRTGITKFNQGLDSDAINKTVGGMKMARDQSDQMEEYLARNFANAVGKMFAKKYRMMRRYGQPFQIMVDGEFRTVDPKQWPEQVRINVRVGLGSGRKDQRLVYRQQLGELQRACIEGGLRIVGEEQVYNLASGAVRDMNLGNPNDYFVDPATLGEQEEKPDPEMAKAQAEAQLKAAEIDAKQQESQANLVLKQQEAEAKIALMREESAAKIALEDARQQREAALAMRQQDFEMDMAERRFAFEQQQAEKKAEVEAASVKKHRPGGALDR